MRRMRTNNREIRIAGSSIVARRYESQVVDRPTFT